MANPLTSRQKAIIASIASGIDTGALILSFQDINDTGTDDDIAKVLQITANGFRKVASTRTPLNRNTILRIIAEGLLEEIEEEPQ